jgi:N-acetylglucosaminyldiphosphoundecaprenol N-acetyl-beta-D-mannosaminyltransferase
MTLDRTIYSVAVAEHGYAPAAHRAVARPHDADPLPVTSMFGLHFSVMPLKATLTELGRRAAARRGTLVMTCNVDHLVMLRRNHHFRQAYAAAHLVTADGAPIVAFSKVVDPRVPERVTGVDVVTAMPDLAAEHGLRVALVGGGEGVAQQAARTMRDRAPTMPQPLALTPPMGFVLGSADDADVIRRLQAYDPHVVVVCFGAPRQELWMHAHHDDLPGAVMLGGGASLDFLVGLQKRAPGWVQQSGLEWVWRLSHDFPRLARRYLVQDLAIVPIMARELRQVRRRRRLTGSPAAP